MDTSFVDDLNADSVDLMDLSVALEEEFGIEEMGDEDVSSIATVGDVVHFLQSRLD
jgi:acyl carrier protein